jgi:radical SAM-linked protein
MYRMTFTFTKQGWVRYISHLDVMRLFARALRRAQIPIKLTEGFNPHPKISLKRALKLGVESECEEGEITLNRFMPEEEFVHACAQQLPEGVRITKACLKRY